MGNDAAFTKIIYLSAFQKKPAHLTKPMIAGLIEAWARQKCKVPFGPADLKGNYINILIRKGLLVVKEMPFPNEAELSWQLSIEGNQILQAFGINTGGEISVPTIEAVVHFLTVN